MTAKALLAALVLAIACTSVALAADYSVSANNGGNSVTVSNDNAGYSDGQWSGRWVDNAWTPGYWDNGSWHQATWDSASSDWTVSLSGDDYTLSQSDWDAIPQAPRGSTPRSTSDVDNARSAEYDNGTVKGYSSTREPGMYDQGDDKSTSRNMDNDRGTSNNYDNDKDDDDHYAGAKCGGNYGGGCGCNKCGSKCGGGCGSKCGSNCGCNKCGSRCGSKCGSRCGGGCGSKCGSKCGSCGSKCGSGGCSTCGHKSCDCPGAHYDCWGVSQEEDHYSSEDIRDSDYDPVLGDGGRGSHGFFGW